MQRRSFWRFVAAALVLAGIAGLVFALRPRAGTAPMLLPDEPAPPARAAQKSEAAVAALLTSTPEERLEAAERAVDAARAQRAAATAELAEAEAEMEPREREVEELERFIADLEARGEDPAQHAEEGLALFNSAREGYERTALRIEQAQNAIQVADDELATAEKMYLALQSEHAVE